MKKSFINLFSRLVEYKKKIFFYLNPKILIQHNKAIVKLENTVASLVDYAVQLEKIVGVSGNFSSTNLNSLYIDRYPQTSKDFEEWEKYNWYDIYECLKDREFNKLFELAMCQIASTPSPGNHGDYLEFGCCGAGSFLNAISKARKWRLFNMNFHAFDSFEGLPTDGTLAFTEEQFWGLIKKQGIFVDKVKTYKGFYNQSLTFELQQEFITSKRKVVFVNLDCDLHESAVPVFNFIAPLISAGTIINLDDFYGTFKQGYEFGTALAFFDFVNIHPTLGFYPFHRSGHGSMSFIAYEKKIFSNSPIV